MQKIFLFYAVELIKLLEFSLSCKIYGTYPFYLFSLVGDVPAYSGRGFQLDDLKGSFQPNLL